MSPCFLAKLLCFLIFSLSKNVKNRPKKGHAMSLSKGKACDIIRGVRRTWM